MQKTESLKIFLENISWFCSLVIYLQLLLKGASSSTIQDCLICNHDGWPRSALIIFCATAFTPWQALSGVPVRDRASHKEVWAHWTVLGRGEGCRRADYQAWTKPLKSTHAHLCDQSLGLYQGTLCDSHCQCLIDGSDKPDITTPLKCARDFGGHNRED